jgi:hypothetical protein
MSYISRVPDIDGLPGAALVLRGLSDARSGTESVESLLIAIGAPRLASLGIDVPEWSRDFREAELRLYARLGDAGEPDPYSRYNALIRELVSFERALEHRVSREKAAQGSR